MSSADETFSAFRRDCGLNWLASLRLVHKSCAKTTGSDGALRVLLGSTKDKNMSVPVMLARKLASRRVDQKTPG